MFIKTYTIPTPGLGLDMAHVYEHSIIVNFYDFIRRKDYEPALIGWVNGESFADRIEIEVGLYDSVVGSLCDNYMSVVTIENKPNLNVIANVEAEERSLISIHNNSVDILPAPKNFKDFTVAVWCDTLNEYESKLFLRASVLINDLIFMSMLSEPTYLQGSSDVYKQDNLMAFLCVYSVRAGKFSPKQLEKRLTERLQNFDLDKNRQAIKQHFDVFAGDSMFNIFPAKYLENTGIKTSNQEIAGLATIENLKRLFKKIHILVRPSETEDYKHI